MLCVTSDAEFLYGTETGKYRKATHAVNKQLYTLINIIAIMILTMLQQLLG